jgi:hypothetical protein
MKLTYLFVALAGFNSLFFHDSSAQAEVFKSTTLCRVRHVPIEIQENSPTPIDHANGTIEETKTGLDWVTQGKFFSCDESSNTMFDGIKVHTATNSPEVSTYPDGTKPQVFARAQIDMDGVDFDRIIGVGARKNFDGSAVEVSLDSTREVESVVANSKGKIETLRAGPNGSVQAGGESKKLYISDAIWLHDYQDPLKDETHGQMFYKVAVVPNTPEAKAEMKAGKDVKGLYYAYVNGDSIRSSSAEVSENIHYNAKTEATAECNECKAEKQKAIKAQAEELKRTLEEASTNAKKEKAKKALSDAGCSAVPATNGKDALKQVERRSKNKNLVTSFMGFLNHFLAGEKKQDPTPEQLATIDLLARTMYGEMRSCHYNKGDRYSKAQARVLFNRAQNCVAAAKSGHACEYIDAKTPLKPTDSFEKALSLVIAKPDAILAWNNNDPNARQLLCIQKNDRVGQKIYQEMIGIATEAVLDKEEFKSETSGVGDHIYNYVSINDRQLQKATADLKRRKVDPRCKIDRSHSPTLENFVQCELPDWAQKLKPMNAPNLTKHDESKSKKKSKEKNETAENNRLDDLHCMLLLEDKNS